MRRLGFFVHDVLAHPLCGLLWIVGEWIPAFEGAGEWLHEWSLFDCNVPDEVWPPEAAYWRDVRENL